MQETGVRKRILVTGSKGFLGRNLLAALRRRDDVQIDLFDSDCNIDNLAQTSGRRRRGVPSSRREPDRNEDDFARVNRGLTGTIAPTTCRQPVEGTGRL